MPAGRPKSDATRIKNLEAQLETLQAELDAAYKVANDAREAPIEMSVLFLDMWCILEDMIARFDHLDEGLVRANLMALKLMADKGSDMHY